MLLDVLDHTVAAPEARVAVGAVVRRLTRVPQHMSRQMLGALEGRVTVRARVGPAALVLRAPVLRQQAVRTEVLAAVRARQLRPCNEHYVSTL